MEGSDKQINNSKPWLWKKGQSGNLKGRPKGVTMKEYVRDFLAKMTDEERDEWLEGIPKIEIFKMAEGNPKQDTDVKHEGEIKIGSINYIVPNDNITTDNTDSDRETAPSIPSSD